MNPTLGIIGGIFLGMIFIWVVAALWAKGTAKQTPSRFNLKLPKDDLPDPYATLDGIEDEDEAEHASEDSDGPNP